MLCMSTCKSSKPPKTESGKSKLAFIDYIHIIFCFLYPMDESGPLPTEMLNPADYEFELRRPKDEDDLE